jgi:hypothetical protein
VPRALVSGVQQLVDARLMQSTRMDAAVLVGVRGVHGIWLCIPLLLLVRGPRGWQGVCLSGSLVCV